MKYLLWHSFSRENLGGSSISVSQMESEADFGRYMHFDSDCWRRYNSWQETSPCDNACIFFSWVLLLNYKKDTSITAYSFYSHKRFKMSSDKNSSFSINVLSVNIYKDIQMIKESTFSCKYSLKYDSMFRLITTSCYCHVYDCILQ